LPPRVLILRAPGTNCDLETAFAFERVGGVTERVHIGRLLERPALLDAYQILCIPGGFSYGDDLAAGRILGNQIRGHLAETVNRFRDAGKLILGICNGFQALLKSGMLLADEPPGPAATLTWNDSGKFEDRWVSLRSHGSLCELLRGVEQMELPVAHAEGKFVARDRDTLSRLDAAGQLVLRYQARNPSDGNVGESVPFPDNPNGAMAHVAGVCDPTGRVLGMMPHPERFVEGTQHPRWTRQPHREHGDGLPIFRNAVRYFS
jgi:phosphoribosylformylglycinamidine synthase